MRVVTMPATVALSSCLNGFTCTINDPLWRVKLIATDTSSSTSGALLSLGVFTLRVLDSGVSWLYGTIVELVRNAHGTLEELRTTLGACRALRDTRPTATHLWPIAVVYT